MTQSGTATPALNTLNVFGLGSITTSAPGNLNTVDIALTGLTNHAVLVGAGTTTITKLAVGTNGQVLIGSTGADPIFNSLTSSDGSITFTPGPGTLDLKAVAGTGAVEHLTGDTGGILNPDGANNFNLFGQLAGSTVVFDTIGSASTVKFESRAWLSRYVVDTSTTVGLRGTYSTLQAAITQAIADGATGVGVTIFIRNCTINETITVSTASVNIVISGPSGIDNQNQGAGNPLFSGSFTNSGTGAIAFTNINISGTVTNSSSGQIYINNSVISGTIVNSSTGALICSNSFGSTLTGTLSGGGMNFYACGLSGGTITLSNNAALALYYTTWSGTLAGSTSTSVSFNNSYINLAANTLSSGTLINFNSVWSTFNYYNNSNVTYQMANSTYGNTLQAVRTAVSYVVLANQDFYIGVTSTAAPRTITLLNTNIIKNQSWIIKDESGGAGTNNISITVAGGVKTIDGLTTYLINNNYGSVRLIYDGTNYFIF